MIYEMMDFEHLFQDKDTIQTFHKICKDPFPPIQVPNKEDLNNTIHSIKVSNYYVNDLFPQNQKIYSKVLKILLAKY
jgi:hypothetical protein